MTSFPKIVTAARAAGLGVVGAFHATPEELVPSDAKTVVLLGPDGPDMWQVFTASAEFSDDQTHGLDRWSRRVVTDLAQELEAMAVFPFGGPPYMPFQRWAAKGEAAVVSPVAMQASPTRGLWASYRGALLFDAALEIPDGSQASPCAPCPKPCRTACPVDAFRDGNYDTERCVAHVNSPDGTGCRNGCLVRRACPVGAQITLPEQQRAFHMAAFLRAHS